MRIYLLLDCRDKRLKMGAQLEPANHHGVRRPIGREPSLLRLFLTLTFLVTFIPRMSASSRPRSADILRQNARRQRVVCSGGSAKLNPPFTDDKVVGYAL
jgi:hypothetical protein